MKMNKIIIPAAMLAVGVALVGSVSSTLAWYQYSTKAQAAFIGTSVGKSENLEIKTIDGENTKWKSNVTAAEVNKLAGITNVNKKELIPITTGQLGADEALPAQFYSGIETGVAGYGEQDHEHIATNKNYVQFTLNIRYKKIEANTEYLKKSLKLIDLTIVDESGYDLSEAVRVHFAAAGATPKYNLFAKNSSSDAQIVTATGGKLDTDSDGALDKELKYEFAETPAQEVVYGFADSTQTALNANNVATSKPEIGILPAENEEGLAVTVTIWIEGWTKLQKFPTDTVNDNGSPARAAIWDPTIYSNAVFNVGMRFQAEDIA